MQNPIKTHEMDVLEASEDETLESHSILPNPQNASPKPGR